MGLNAVREKINEVREETNIKDANLRKKLEGIMNNVCIQKLDNEHFVFFKHFASKKKGIIYQLILSGDHYDGIYEFKIFGHDLQFVSRVGKPLKIKTKSNFDLAEFDVKNIITTITKTNDIQFNQDLKKIQSSISNYDTIIFYLNDEEININNGLQGEVKTKRQIREILRTKSNKILKVDFIEKKKKHYISRYDLGEREFKSQLFELDLVSPEEYELYTKFNSKLYKEYQGKFKEVEIIE